MRMGIGFALASLAYLLWTVLRPNPLAGAATNMVVALRDGDGDGLYQAAITQERQCSALTPQKLRAVWEILIQPETRTSKLLRVENGRLESNRAQATAFVRYLDHEGNPWSLDMIANKSEEGPKSAVVYTMLSTASLFDDEGIAHPNLTVDLSLAGLRRYRPRLEAIGIERIMLNPNNCVTWDQLEGILERAARSESRSRGGG